MATKATKISDLYMETIDAQSRTIDDWHREFWDEKTEDEAGRYWEAQRCETCKAAVVSTSGDERHCDLDLESECEGNVCGSEGPMMAYFYPCPFGESDAEEVALAIVDLPLCVVKLANGDMGFALTGGGMDLSWEICAAYIAAGYLPPLDMASRLPRYDMHSTSQRARRDLVLLAVKRAAKVQADRAKDLLKRIEAHARDAKADDAKIDARKA